MEALGTPASLLALISITTELTTACNEYRRHLIHAPKSLLFLTEELASFRLRLEDLMRIFDSQDERDNALLARIDLLNGAGGPLQLYASELNGLLKLLQLDDNSTRRGSRLLRMKWPFTEKEALRKIESIKRHRHTVDTVFTPEYARCVPILYVVIHCT